MLFRKPRHRVFDYTPRFYKPEKDEQERRKRKLGFRRNSIKKRQKRSPIIWGIMVVLVILVYLKLIGSI